MKKNIILVIVVSLLFFLVGCSENDNVDPDMGISIIQLDMTPIKCIDSMGVCSYVCSLAFEDNSTYENCAYWAAFWKDDSIYAKGDTCSRDNLTMKLVIYAHYFDVPQGDYELKIFKCDFQDEVWDLSEAEGYNGTYVTIGGYDPDCHKACCTNTYYPNKGHFYATAKKPNYDIIGVSAYIKTRYGKLCGCDYGSDEYTKSIVHVNVSNENNKMIWAQTGYIHIRFEGTTLDKKKVYCEVVGDNWIPYYEPFQSPPTEGDEHLYMCSLQVSTGTWRSYYDQMLIWPITDPAWQNTYGLSASWTGEIYCPETDMAGTDNNPCEISECKYKTEREGFIDAHFSTYSEIIGSDNLHEWGIDYDNTTIYIWDKNPLP